MLAVEVPECQTNDDCADDRYCNLETRTCEDPCLIKRCGSNALCNATRHQAVCQCITGFLGDPYINCSEYSRIQKLVVAWPVQPT